MRLLVLTTSYPRDADDSAGAFVASAVEALRAHGIDVAVVSPASFRHFGLAYGHGIVGNIRRRPWLVLLLPLFLWSFRRAARRVDCDLVHAHWLGAGLVAATLGKPFVVQLWGTDAELARRAPWVARAILRRARLAIGASPYLAEEARRLGARDARVVPTGVDIPAAPGPPEEPLHVLYAGRLSPEKGIADFLAATAGLPRVVVGAGPLAVPESVGQVPPSRLGGFYERAAVVACPSRREGYGVVAREAMAWGRPVVATAVGGLVDAVVDGETGLLVPPGDIAALRAAVERLLADRNLRERLGAAARARAVAEYSWDAAVRALLDAYEAPLRATT